MDDVQDEGGNEELSKYVAEAWNKLLDDECDSLDEEQPCESAVHVAEGSLARERSDEMPQELPNETTEIAPSELSGYIEDERSTSAATGMVFCESGARHQADKEVQFASEIKAEFVEGADLRSEAEHEKRESAAQLLADSEGEELGRESLTTDVTDVNLVAREQSDTQAVPLRQPQTDWVCETQVESIPQINISSSSNLPEHLQPVAQEVPSLGSVAQAVPSLGSVAQKVLYSSYDEPVETVAEDGSGEMQYEPGREWATNHEHADSAAGEVYPEPGGARPDSADHSFSRSYDSLEDTNSELTNEATGEDAQLNLSEATELTSVSVTTRSKHETARIDDAVSSSETELYEELSNHSCHRPHSDPQECDTEMMTGEVGGNSESPKLLNYGETGEWLEMTGSHPVKLYSDFPSDNGSLCDSLEDPETMSNHEVR